MKKELDRKELAKQAFEECCSAETTVRYGVKRARPFWNVESTQFMCMFASCHALSVMSEYE